jgi:hypothetical protein
MSEKTVPQGEALSETAQQFVDAIDAKFKEADERGGEVKRGDAVRDHEESVELLAGLGLPEVPSTAKVFAERPIPEEAEDAEAKWTEFGGHRVTASFSTGTISTQLDFLIRDGQLAMRRREYQDDPLSGSGKGNKVAFPQLIEEPSLAFGGISEARQKARIDARSRGAPIGDPSYEGQVVAWVENAVVAPPADRGPGLSGPSSSIGPKAYSGNISPVIPISHTLPPRSPGPEASGPGPESPGGAS